MPLQVLYHGNCFDGFASAALFGRFARDRLGIPADQIRYRPLQHQQGDPFPADAFQAELVACVDFRFSPKVHWWFDHHASAFPSLEDRRKFEEDRSGQKYWDPTAPSCTGLIARTLASRFAWRADDLVDLVHWAEIIDSARFDSPHAAVALEEPALRVMTLVESNKDPDLPPRLIAAMQGTPLQVIASEPWFTAQLAPILERHQLAIQLVKANARLRGGVVEVDLGDTPIEAANKFIAYDLYPHALYTVVVSRDARRTKVSVGSNPWTPERRRHDISKLCEKYGGGGHPVVGAVSLAAGALPEARRIAAEIADALRDGAEP